MQRRRLFKRRGHNPHLLLDRGKPVAAFRQVIYIVLNIYGGYPPMAFEAIVKPSSAFSDVIRRS